MSVLYIVQLFCCFDFVIVYDVFRKILEAEGRKNFEGRHWGTGAGSYYSSVLSSFAGELVQTAGTCCLYISISHA